MPPRRSPSSPAGRAEFRALLERTTAEALRHARSKRRVEGFPLLLRQLEALCAWTATGLEPDEEQRSLIVLDRIAALELAGAGLPAGFLRALESLQDTLDRWPVEAVPERTAREGESPVPALLYDLDLWIEEADLPPPPVRRPAWWNRLRAVYYRLFPPHEKIAFHTVPFFRAQLAATERESEYRIGQWILSMRMLLDTFGRALEDGRLAHRLAEIVDRTESALAEGWWAWRDELPRWAPAGEKPLRDEPVDASLAAPQSSPVRSSVPDRPRTAGELRALLARTRSEVAAWSASAPRDERAERLARMLSALALRTRGGRTPSIHERGALPLRRFAARELGGQERGAERATFLAAALPALEEGFVGWPANGVGEGEDPELGTDRASLDLRLELSLEARGLLLEAAGSKEDREAARALGALARDLLARLADAQRDLSTLLEWTESAEELLGEMRSSSARSGGLRSTLAELLRRAREASELD